MQPSQPVCLVCNRTSDQAPLIAVQYRDGQYWICAQDLPILIHKPAKLSEKLPGAENFGPPAEGHSHG